MAKRLPPGWMNLDSCLEAIRDDSARIAACAEQGDLGAPVLTLGLDQARGWLFSSQETGS